MDVRLIAYNNDSDNNTHTHTTASVQREGLQTQGGCGARPRQVAHNDHRDNGGGVRGLDGQHPSNVLARQRGEALRVLRCTTATP